jgi:hypothetical protein
MVAHTCFLFHIIHRQEAPHRAIPSSDEPDGPDYKMLPDCNKVDKDQRILGKLTWVFIIT